MADRAVSAVVGLPRRGRGAPPGVAAAPQPVVQPRRLLPAARLWRYARSLPRGPALEAPARGAQGRQGPDSARGRGGLLDHVAAGRGRRRDRVAEYLAD